MSRTIEIKCDACNTDLTYTGNCEDYYLSLSNGSKAPWYAKEGLRGGAVTAMAISPSLSREHHFCDLRCLDHWRGRENFRSKLWSEWHETLVEARSANMTSYRHASDDERNTARAEIDAAAIQAFPLAKPKRL